MSSRAVPPGESRPSLPSSPHDPWTAAADGWCSWLRDRGRTTTTVAGYRKHVGWLAGDLVDHLDEETRRRSPWQLSSDDLEQWLEEQNWSQSTRRRVLVSLKSFYNWGVATGQCRTSPLSGIELQTPRPRGPRTLPLPAAWERPLAAYLDEVTAAGSASGTFTTRRDRLSHFARAHADPWSVSHAECIRWMSRSDWSPAYKRSVRASLRGFYGWARRHGHVVIDPAAELPSVREPRALPRPATDEAVRHALGLADDRVRLAMKLALYAGLRRAEISTLHTRDIGADQIRVRGKGGRERIVPLHPTLKAVLTAELERRRRGGPIAAGWGPHVPGPDGWLFPGDVDGHVSARHLGKLISAVLPAGWTAHTLRHRFATEAYRSDRDLRAVQELLGHSKPESTARYAAVPDGALRSAVAGVSSFG